MVAIFEAEELARQNGKIPDTTPPLVNANLPRGSVPPLHFACQKVLGPTFYSLIQPPHTTLGSKGFPEGVDLLLAKGADVLRRDREGWTCLHSACAVPGNLRILTKLLGQEHLPHTARTTDGSTALHFFARNFKLDRSCLYLFELLLLKGPVPYRFC